MEIREEADKTAPTNEEGFDSLNEGWDTEDAVTEGGAEETQEETVAKAEKPVEKKDNESSAIYQKRRYREQLKEAQKRIEELERKYDSSSPKSEEEAREQQAREALRRLLREELDSLESERSKADEEAEELLQEELEEVLASNPSFSEKEILDVCEELTVSPKTAVGILNRERRTKKTPPKLPQPKTGSPKTETATTKPKDFEEAGSLIKELLRKGKTY